jgi:hypothetical protein
VSEPREWILRVDDLGFVKSTSLGLCIVQRNENIHVIEISALRECERKLDHSIAVTQTARQEWATALKQVEELQAEMNEIDQSTKELVAAYEERGMAMRNTGDMTKSLYAPKNEKLNKEVGKLRALLGEARDTLEKWRAYAAHDFEAGTSPPYTWDECEQETKDTLAKLIKQCGLSPLKDDERGEE